jgi:mannose-6-phosphate isomerase-like protein (cupin superfamily)
MERHQDPVSSVWVVAEGRGKALVRELGYFPQVFASVV